MRLDHLLSKEHRGGRLRVVVQFPVRGECSRGDSSWVEHRLVGAGVSWHLVLLLRGDGTVGAGGWLLGTLLGPEGVAVLVMISGDPAVGVPLRLCLLP